MSLQEQMRRNSQPQQHGGDSLPVVTGYGRNCGSAGQGAVAVEVMPWNMPAEGEDNRPQRIVAV